MDFALAKMIVADPLTYTETEIRAAIFAILVDGRERAEMPEVWQAQALDDDSACD